MTNYYRAASSEISRAVFFLILISTYDVKLKIFTRSAAFENSSLLANCAVVISSSVQTTNDNNRWQISVFHKGNDLFNRISSLPRLWSVCKYNTRICKRGFQWKGREISSKRVHTHTYVYSGRYNDNNCNLIGEPAGTARVLLKSFLCFAKCAPMSAPSPRDRFRFTRVARGHPSQHTHTHFLKLIMLV